MKTIQGVLWDNDGVLVNTEQLFYESNRDLLVPYGIDLTPKQFFDWFLDNNYGAWHVLLGQGHAIELVDRLRAERSRLFARRLRQARQLAMPGIGSVLAALRPHVAMGVVTSAYAQHVEISHAATGLLPHFDFVLTREMYDESKPAPDGYLLGLQHLGLAATDCVAVEDSPRGLRAANAAGLECIVLRNHMNRDYAFDDAFCVVDSVAELGAVLAAFVPGMALACQPGQQLEASL
ncbi:MULTISPECIES: HAD family phosphatase [unclassified Janthinobacterium]|uniref:HAD family hydrolase n=1 Tax=unclassified Janthinobacterium TaxID=2610881 RepID=UPI0008870C04|nr:MULTISPECIES: HAD family phosphatase [unclassified Janthinobacterium]SDA74828.1 haloacid dehalogenase superfamily, subfamily IA, variant 3 with third motif having DD or ED [Janthinobacterium sp. 551a]SFB58199.1 haloacid dehalogenase superfamily, subfamily IA, variant 3 with third motif having DD or ED [Janthinobacterium sp. 344]